MHSWNVHMLLTCKRHQIFTFSGKHLFTCSATMRWESGGCVEHQVVWDWGGGQQRETNRGALFGGRGGRGGALAAQSTHSWHTPSASQRQTVKMHWWRRLCSNTEVCRLWGLFCPWWLRLQHADSSAIATIASFDTPPSPPCVSPAHDPITLTSSNPLTHGWHLFYSLIY